MSASFAERLNRLFNVVCPPGRGPYTSAEVVKALNQQGFSISAPYMSQLRSGKRGRPSLATIRQLAAFFRVDPAYFLDDDYYERISAELTVLEAMHDDGLRRIANRVCGLSPASQLVLVETIEELRRRENLDSVSSPSGSHNSPLREQSVQ
ncbi:Helix-turn-helix protein [Mycolicibacterium phlei]|jgi:transcriptional regulator with XRE-family HTH domain|uniref:Secretion protein EspR n=1 Tax=Mycolicibacterium phlei DSM 43239 = CCUG 21000 TaxID=1226750 RepID=A0A5N5UQ48_MYCPH|nr:helix-turn-helix domain-containing protein [Mycolicibacterium phlei]VEG08181.1 Helix-turn-helix protein [Mycobacteroides chelonae]AMO60059.1 Nucleoid-associated protein EspR [Mycolicibacterium phlei]KAB7751722.1 secretion protein EspR [Mycolicibacterium phlei DSM 43239 = CCUG 21000]KXW60307.1 secretion protein EspR [Mycolicibacterium phlei DSM 43239 = CCUG 21000]KXW65935.1 hypothetical protein MPHL43070_21365 [Mycolicibacterium phlei DSM 43070]